MTKRDQTSRQAYGGESSRHAKGQSSRPATEPGVARSDDSLSASEDEECHTDNKITPIERIFLQEVGREMEPEERQILLGIHRTRRKSRAGVPNRPSSRNR